MRHSGKELFALSGVDGCIDAEVAGEDAIDVAIDDGCRQIESYGANGCCGIVANAFQFFDFFNRVGETTTGDDLLGCIVQIASSTVVAQPLPFAQYLVFRRSSECFDSRPTVHKAFPVFPALLDLCLLKNDFRKPYSIWVASLSPRQIASVLAEPG